MRVLAIDPGSEESGYVLIDSHGMPESFGKVSNAEMMRVLRGAPREWADVVVIEWSAPRGMPASAQFLETVWWGGRFYEIVESLGPDGPPAKRVGRAEVKRHLCGNHNAKDTNVIAALIDRYGGIGGKDAAVGVKARQGPLYGVHRDVWQALAVGLTYQDTEESM